MLIVLFPPVTRTPCVLSVSVLAPSPPTVTPLPLINKALSVLEPLRVALDVTFIVSVVAAESRLFDVLYALKAVIPVVPEYAAKSVPFTTIRAPVLLPVTTLLLLPGAAVKIILLVEPNPLPTTFSAPELPVLRLANVNVCTPGPALVRFNTDPP